MLKKAVQQGRREFSPSAYPLGYAEGLHDARTLRGKKIGTGAHSWMN